MAGKQAGLEGERSGLWYEYLRVITMLRPRIVLIENVRNLLSKGMPEVLRGLRGVGYDAEWSVIPAAAVGAAHLRERVWIVARPTELAQAPVFGDVEHKKGDPVEFDLDGKLPRDGRMNSHLRALEPLAPRKTQRRDGWTHWTGVNLWDGALPTPTSTDGERGQRGAGSVERGGGISLNEKARLLPTPRGTDGERDGRGDLIQVVRGNQSPSGHFASGLWPSASASASASARDYKDVGDGSYGRGQLPEAVRDRALLPTPVAYGNGNDPVSHMAKKADKCGGPRGTITNLDVIARNYFKQANGVEYPSVRVQGAVELGASVGHGVVEVDGSRRIDEPLALSAARGAESGGWSGPDPLYPTPSAASAASAAQGPGRSGREGGDNLVTRLNGSLNPDWVEWLMAWPIGWTDLSCEAPVQHPWWFEPEGIPRVATGIKDRTKRLRAIGNGIVWPCAYIALRRALEATPL